MTSLKESIKCNLLDGLSGVAALPTTSAIDRLDATLLSRIDLVYRDPVRPDARQATDSESAIAQMLSYAIKRYQSALLTLLQGDTEFITRQASNIVAAKVSGAVNYAGPMRNQREAILAHYNAKFGSVYQFALAVALPVSALKGDLPNTFRLLSGTSHTFVRPFTELVHSELGVVMMALRGTGKRGFPTDLFNPASKDCLALNMELVEQWLTCYLSATPEPVLAKLQSRIDRERSLAAYAPRPLDAIVLGRLFHSVNA